MTSHGRKHMGLAIATMLLLLTTTATASAQSSAEIEGSVVDANGNPLPGAVVTVSGPDGPQEHVTGVEGGYIAVDLAVGDYLVTAALPGFETTELTIALRAGMRETVRIVMQIARLLETVSVVADEPRIFARNVVAEPMMLQQSNITSVTSVVDNLPGVSVQEGDAYGFDDWSSNVAVRGFQVTISEAQRDNSNRRSRASAGASPSTVRAVRETSRTSTFRPRASCANVVRPAAGPVRWAPGPSMPLC